MSSAQNTCATIVHCTKGPCKGPSRHRQIYSQQHDIGIVSLFDGQFLLRWYALCAWELHRKCRLAASQLQSTAAGNMAPPWASFALFISRIFCCNPLFSRENNNLPVSNAATYRLPSENAKVPCWARSPLGPTSRKQSWLLRNYAGCRLETPCTAPLIFANALSSHA